MLELASGEEPCARFGHTCVPVIVSSSSSSPTFVNEQQLVFTGGSNGSDLWRNGDELKDVSIYNTFNSILPTTYYCL